MTKDDLAAQIARVDDMIERCAKIAGKERDKPLRLDQSLPRYVPPKPKPAPNPMPPPVSWEPQQRFEEIRRTGGGYRPLCGHGYGDDVDRAFEECSNAPY